MSASAVERPLTGLTEAEVAERVNAGKVNAVPDAPVRTLGEIVRANVFTWVNLIVGTLFVLILIAGHPADGLFVGVILSNTAIGIYQELRARKTLQELAVLNAPQAHVIRDGDEHQVPIGEIVADDLLVIRTGDQVAVDGEVLESSGLELDESLLTGEADAIAKRQDDEVMSGSFVVAGTGVIRATKIGAESYASSLAEEAKRFQLVTSGLRRDVDKVLRWQIIIIPPIAILLLIRQLGIHDSWQTAVTDMVAAAVAMVPAGLALLISVAFFVGVIELARRNALAKELASVELLARVDTLCLDKTGTITTGEISYNRAEPAGDVDDAWLNAALATLVAADPNPNPTLSAIASAHEGVDTWSISEVVPFSSGRKWAAVRVDDDGGDGPTSLYLGAPEMVLTGSDDDELVASTRASIAECAEQGQRVLVVARCGEWANETLPSDVKPAGFVVLEDTVRPDANEIFDYFGQQGVTLKVISGDSPRTVAAVAKRAGIPGSEHWLDARELPDDDEALADTLESTTVFGRVSPHQKRAMVHALQSRGHTVAMTGDGVNDVLALKDSDAGISMGSGSAATRAVAQLVLLDNKFSTLPVALDQGRKVINNIERVANLFLTKTAYAVTLVLLIGIAGMQFPFLPRQQTLVDTFSIGLPGLVLALAPAPEPIKPGLLRRVLSFAIPAGVIAGVVCFLLFRSALDRDLELSEARTAATLALLGIALVVLVLASRPLQLWKIGLAVAMLVSYVLAAVIGPVRRFFQLDIPSDGTIRWQIVLGVIIGGVLVVVAREITNRIEARRQAAATAA